MGKGRLWAVWKSWRGSCLGLRVALSGWPPWPCCDCLSEQGHFQWCTASIVWCPPLLPVFCVLRVNFLLQVLMQPQPFCESWAQFIITECHTNWLPNGKKWLLSFNIKIRSSQNHHATKLAQEWLVNFGQGWSRKLKGRQLWFRRGQVVQWGVIGGSGWSYIFVSEETRNLCYLKPVWSDFFF